MSENNRGFGEPDWVALRHEMVERQLVRRNIKDSLVLDSMRTVPRHQFVPIEYRLEAYDDSPLPIGWEQTISQPYIVASMTEQLSLSSKSRVLEIGTGCGYQTAVLSQIVSHVFTIEIIGELLMRTNETFDELGCQNITTKCGDGSVGWAEHAQYDGIIVTAAAPEIPDELIDQLADGGQMIIPVGPIRSAIQGLMKISKKGGKIVSEKLYDVRFVRLRSLEGE